MVIKPIDRMGLNIVYVGLRGACPNLSQAALVCVFLQPFVLHIWAAVTENMKIWDSVVSSFGADHSIIVWQEYCFLHVASTSNASLPFSVHFLRIDFFLACCILFIVFLPYSSQFLSTTYNFIQIHSSISLIRKQPEFLWIKRCVCLYICVCISYIYIYEKN